MPGRKIDDQKAMKLADQGKTTEEIAKLFGVSRRTARKAIQRARDPEWHRKYLKMQAIYQARYEKKKGADKTPFYKRAQTKPEPQLSTEDASLLSVHDVAVVRKAAEQDTPSANGYTVNGWEWADENCVCRACGNTIESGELAISFNNGTADCWLHSTC